MNKKSITVSGIDDKLIKETALSYVIAILLVLVSIAFIYPRFKDVESVKKKLETAAKKTRSVQTNLESLDQVSSLVPAADQEMLFEALPSVLNPGLLLNSIREVSQENQVSIMSYSLGGGDLEETDPNANVAEKSKSKKPKPQNAKSGELKIELVGTGSGLIAFMDQIERSLPMLSITDVQVSMLVEMIGGTVDQNQLKLAMALDYYYYPYKATGEKEMDKYLIKPEDIKLMSMLRDFRRPAEYMRNGIEINIPGGNPDIFDEN